MKTENDTPSARDPDAFDRTRRLLGPDRMRRLAAAHVTVAGLGGVGSYTVEALARSGIGSLRLCDPDRVEPSNLNRQLLALHSTLGRFKAEVAAARILDINPGCLVAPCVLRLTPGNADDFLAVRTDVLVDAIDDLPAKTALLLAAVRRGIPVVSAMGAARHLDPAALRADDLFHSCTCPLARRLRRALRREGVSTGIRCVYSAETPLNGPGGPAGTGGHGPPGSIAHLTGAAGLRLAWEAVRLLIRPDDTPAPSA